MGNRKRSLKNFLLRPGFQLKYSLFIAITGGLVFGVMAALFFDKVRENSQLAAIDVAVAVAPPGPGAATPSPVVIGGEPLAPPGESAAPTKVPGDDAFARELAEQLRHEDQSVLWLLGVFSVALVLTLFLVGILATHRIVGPIHVVERMIEQVMAGQPITKRKLRRGDEFVDLFNQVNQLAEALTDERRHDVERVDRALQALQVKVAKMTGVVDREELRSWIDEALAPAREIVEEKRSYVHTSETTPPSAMTPPPI